MPPFTFEFDTVLRHRTRQEQARMRAVGEIEAQRLAVEDRVARVQAGLRAGRDELRGILASAGPALPVPAIRLAAGAGLAGLVQLRRAAVDLAGTNQRLARARADLLRATIARKAIQLLKDRRHAAWKRSEDRRETSGLDDLVVMRHAARPADPVSGAL